MVLGVRLNIEAGRFPAVIALAARCSLQLTYTDISLHPHKHPIIVQELCESRGGRPGLSVLTSLLVSVDVKIY